MPLTYRFYFEKKGVEKTICNSYKSHCNETLPSGDPDHDYKLLLFVDVVDSLGGITKHNLTAFVCHIFTTPEII